MTYKDKKTFSESPIFKDYYFPCCCCHTEAYHFQSKKFKITYLDKREEHRSFVIDELKSGELEDLKEEDFAAHNLLELETKEEHKAERVKEIRRKVYEIIQRIFKNEQTPTLQVMDERGR